jgi:predicted RNA binding protein YcfA (HicA-like mRNA interferase family)
VILSIVSYSTSNIKKLTKRLLTRPTDMRFAEIRMILEHYGWRLDRMKGSHRVFVKDGDPNRITLPEDGKKVKGPYLLSIIKLLGIGEENNHEERR